MGLQKPLKLCVFLSASQINCVLIQFFECHSQNALPIVFILRFANGGIKFLSKGILNAGNAFGNRELVIAQSERAAGFFFDAESVIQGLECSTFARDPCQAFITLRASARSIAPS